MSYGVFQEYFSGNWTLQGGVDAAGTIGTTSNGVMYLAMPFLFALFTRRWAHRRRTAALCGVGVASLGFLLSSFSTHVWHLVATQGVLAALGCALVYSPTTLYLGEWFSSSDRAVAYGLVLSCKNIVGSACPFLLRYLLERYGFPVTIRLWAAVATVSSIPAVFLIPPHPSSRIAAAHPSQRRTPWHFLGHPTFYVFVVATALQSSGYGIPQTYLTTYAHDVTLLDANSATLLLTLFNAPGIVASSFFGYLSDNKRLRLSAATVTAIPSIGAALAAFLFWGPTAPGGMGLLTLFSITFGFFSGGYSATCGGVINELEREAARNNEAIDSGLLYGLLNGARGVGYVAGGVSSVPLLKAGRVSAATSVGYGTAYGALIIFTGLSSALGGWGLIWKFLR